MTAIAVAERDDRVKALFAFDAWLWCVHEKIQSGEYKLNIPQIHVVTELFPQIVYDYFKYDTIEEVEKLIENSNSGKDEFLILKNTNHYHQTDVIVIVPLECSLRGQTSIIRDNVELLMANSQAVINWLIKLGIPNSVTHDFHPNLTDEHQEEMLDFLIKYQPQNSTKGDIEIEGDRQRMPRPTTNKTVHWYESSSEDGKSLLNGEKGQSDSRSIKSGKTIKSYRSKRDNVIDTSSLSSHYAEPMKAFGGVAIM